MSLRLKLLLLGLATLVLPWAGCRYAREMESALREGEADSLQALAQTIATSCRGAPTSCTAGPAAAAAATPEAHGESTEDAHAQSAAEPDPNFYKPTPIRPRASGPHCRAAPRRLRG